MNTIKDARIIHTKLYSDIAHEILDSVIGQLSDGWGESNQANEKWWRYTEVSTEPNGEVIIRISRETYHNSGYGSYFRWVENGFNNMNETQVLEKFAMWVKKTMQMELKDNGVTGGWKRNNVSFHTQYLNRDSKISVAQVYCVYDELLGRLCDLGKYDPDILHSVFGSVRDDKQIEHEIEKRKKIDILNAEYETKLAEFDRWKSAQLKEIDTKYYDMRDKAWKKFRKDVEEANQTA